MRKLNQRRPRAIPCTIPRPPTPPQSVQVQSLKKILMTTNKTSSSSLSSDISSTSLQRLSVSSARNAMTGTTTAATSTTGLSSTSQIINSHPHHLQQHHHLVQQQQSQQHHYHQLHNQRLPPLHQHPSLPVRETSHSSTSSTSAFIMKDSSSGESSCSQESNSDTASSSSQEIVTNDPGDAIEPNEEFPAPPEEFLEDIKAFRKQEEIEGPLHSDPAVVSHPSVDGIHSASGQNRGDVTDFVLTSALNHFDSIPTKISRLSFNGNGSLNSSITETETTESSSWSPSTSPVSSPLPSPCPSLSSTQSFSLPDEASSSQRFAFPPGHPLTSSPSSRNSLRLPPNQFHPHHRLPPHPSLIDPSLRNRMTSGRSAGVTLAPLHPSSLQRESIYQRIPTNSHSYGSLPRLPSSSSTSSLTTSALRPPDYMTAMQRLSLSKVSTSKGVTQSTSSTTTTSLPASSSAAQSIPQNNHHRSPPQPLKSIPSLSSSLPEKQSLQTVLENGDNLAVRLRRNSVSSSCSEDTRIFSGQPSSRQPSKASLKVKKRVSFSDQVELVAHSEDMEEQEHLPNPLLERVLGKAFLNSNNIRNA